VLGEGTLEGKIEGMKLFYTTKIISIADIEQVQNEKKPFTLR
jgi:hypothetical protein